MDATCCPADISYPTDLNLLNHSREWLERIIDVLHAVFPQPVKPRTYRNKARQSYLSLTKKRRKPHKQRRKVIRKQLGYVSRNLKTVKKYIEDNPTALSHLSGTEYQRLLVINEVYRQQQEMFDNDSKSISSRIVSLEQPHVRPIVRGKAGAAVEFGVKVSASVVDGFIRCDRYDWDAFNESEDLIPQLEMYRSRYGYYPESVHVDQIYRTRDNRAFCKEKGIRISGPALGRPPKEKDQKKIKQAKQDEVDRIIIEGKFGVAKRKFSLDRIMAKTAHTSIVSMFITFFVMNSEKILRDIFLLLLLFWKKYWNSVRSSSKEIAIIQ